jgi:hypothetical protein
LLGAVSAGAGRFLAEPPQPAAPASASIETATATTLRHCAHMGP